MKERIKITLNNLTKFMKENCLYIIQVTLGVLIFLFSYLYAFINSLSGFAVIVVASFGLLALSMNYRYEEKNNNNKEKIRTRNAWDIWFLSMRTTRKIE